MGLKIYFRKVNDVGKVSHGQKAWANSYRLGHKKSSLAATKLHGNIPNMTSNSGLKFHFRNSFKLSFLFHYSDLCQCNDF